jgi:hypothetical protein
MTREAWLRRVWCALGVVGAAAGCSTTKDPGAAHDAGIDATHDAAIDSPPAVAFEGLTPHEWSLASANGQWQITLADVGGASACALSTDQHNGLGAAGGEIIIHLPVADDSSTPASPCPANNYTLHKCPNDVGTAAFVPAGCGFYRKFDANGAVIGTTPSLTGTVKIAGTATSCTLRVDVGFLGQSFSQQASLTNGATAQPWCLQN